MTSGSAGCRSGVDSADHALRMVEVMEEVARRRVGGEVPRFDRGTTHVSVSDGRGTMSPSVLLSGDRVRLVLGSGGSKRIRTVLLQVISNSIDFDLGIRAAAERLGGVHAVAPQGAGAGDPRRGGDAEVVEARHERD